MTTPRSVWLMVTAEVSATTFYRGYLAYLRDHGWRVTISAASEGRLEPFASSESAIGIDIPMRREPSPAHDLVSLVRTIRELHRARPDVVVAATPKAGLVGMTAAWVTRVPIRVYQLWGLRLETSHGLRRAVFLALEKVSAGLATQVVANSHSLAEEARSLGVANDIVVLGSGSSHGVDLERFSRQADDIAPLPAEVAASLAARADTLVIGYVGRVHRDKGILTLLEAATACSADGIDVTLLIVGPVEDEEVAERLASIDSPRLRVVSTGAVSDIRPYAMAMDVHCLPTLREGFPNVVLETGALEVPTITTRATGARDSVVDGVTGLLVDVEDVTGLAKAITIMASDSDQRRAMGRRAHARARELFDKHHVWSLQEANISRLLESSGTRLGTRSV